MASPPQAALAAGSPPALHPSLEEEAVQGRFRASVFPVLLFVGGFYAAFSGTLFLGADSPWVPTLWALTLILGLAVAGTAWLVRHRDLSNRNLAWIVGSLAALVIVHDLLVVGLLGAANQVGYLAMLLAAAGAFLLPRPALAATHAVGLAGWLVVAWSLGEPLQGQGTALVGSGVVAGWGVWLVRTRVIRLRARQQAVLEGTVQASEERFRTLAETAKDAIILLDEAGRMAYVNPAGLRQLDLSPMEAAGRQLAQHLQGPQGSPRLEDLLGTQEVSVQRRDGTRYPAELSLARAHRGDGVAYTGILRDITERKQAAAASQQAAARESEVTSLRQMNEFKTRFLNMAAHELNTPLTPLRLQLHLLKAEQMGALNERQARAVALLDRNVTRLAALVGELLDVARMQGGRLRLEVRPVSIDEIVDEVLESFDEATRRVEVPVRFAGAQGLLVQADRNRLTQVLFNLVSNAIKFTPAGGNVTIDAARRANDIEVAITDTGLGLTRDQQDRLFQPFVQVHDPMSITASGTGLGLYISRGLVEAQGGHLTVTSPGPGKGSTFRFTLPSASSLQEPPLATVRQTEPELEEDAIVRRLRELI